MKKITDFIVKKRNFILVFFIMLSIFSLYISKDVNINSDMSKYLPNDSETKIGMNIMNKYFDKIKDSDLNIMFKDLSSDEKEEINNYLKNVKSVDKVNYDNTEKYNNGDYTLYTLNVKDYDDSKTSKEVYETIKENYKDYEVFYSGSIVSANEDVLQMWIVVLAVACAFIILIIMCDSYVEPVLILFTILLAVALNKGSNLIFTSISNITDSISAILQMALSVDYSIMLINRYRQEKENNKNKIDAMKQALYHAFKAISSSSLTTIVGLLALVFMSFTIGKDLGFVLAKGVLLSLASIFLCLPGLLIIFDNLIEKTTKNKIHLKLDILGKISYKLRYVFSILFVIVFVVSYLLKGNITTSYTGSSNDKILKHFSENNQVAIIYDNKYENEIGQLCRDIKDDNIEEVLCYGNTINEELTYDKLNSKLNDLGSDTEIDDYLLKIIYYYYYNDSDKIKMSYNDFIKFIENDIYKNNNLNKNIDNDTKNNINRLKNFTNKNLINKKRDSKDMSNLLSIDKNTTQNIYLLNHSEKINIKVDISNFTKFINNQVLTDPTYSKAFTEDQKALIKQLSTFTNKDYITKNLTSKELSNLFNIDKNTVDNLLLLYYINQDTNKKLSLSELILETYKIKNNTNYLDNVNGINEIISLYPIALNKNNINSMKLNKMYLNEYFKDINKNLVNLVYQLANLDSNYTFTPSEFIEFTLTHFNNYLDDNTKNNLGLLKLVIDDTTSTNKHYYSVSELSKLLNIDKNTLTKLYNLSDYINGKEYKLSPNLFVKLILSNKNISAMLDKESLNTLNLLNTIMDSVINNKKYTVKEMSNTLNVDTKNIKLLYSLYDIKVNKYKVKMSSYNFVDYMLKNIVDNKEYKVSNDQKSKLNSIYSVMKSSLNNTKYNYKDAYNNLSSLSDNLDKNLIELVYIYYGSINNYNKDYKLTVEKFINYLNKDIINNNIFKDYLDSDMKKNIIDSQDTINDAKKMLVSEKYSRAILNTNYDLEGKESFEFIKNTREKLNKIGDNIYVIGDTPMAYDMNESFDSEMNLITVLTMLFIFIVVATTFKSLVIPTILVLTIQCAVFLTMGILSMYGEPVYFIALLIVQSILMGATIDYAIVYTSYYLESRENNNILNSIINSYNKSIHTILTSSSILIIVTLIVGQFASDIAAKICITLSKGTLCSALLILILLPSVIAVFDKFIIKKKKV